MKPQLLTTPQAAEYLGGIKPNTLEGQRVRGEGVRFIKIGRLVRYSVADLDAYLEAQIRTSTSQVVA
jgi:excisionase family DNA binding protein